MSIQCPICRSHQAITLDHGKKIGGVIGAVGGVASGLAGATSGAATGAEIVGVVGFVVGPVGVAAVSLAGQFWCSGGSGYGGRYGSEAR